MELLLLGKKIWTFLINNFTDILMLVTTYFIYRIGRNTFIANDSPRLIITHIKWSLLQKDDKENQKVTVTVKNYGNGVSPRTFLCAKTKERDYKTIPIGPLSKNDTRQVALHIPRNQEILEIFMVTQDFFNKIYHSRIDFDLKEAIKNKHIETFLTLPVRRSWIGKWKINRFLKNAYLDLNSKVKDEE